MRANRANDAVISPFQMENILRAKYARKNVMLAKTQANLLLGYVHNTREDTSLRVKCFQDDSTFNNILWISQLYSNHYVDHRGKRNISFLVETIIYHDVLTE